MRSLPGLTSAGFIAASGSTPVAACIAWARQRVRDRRRQARHRWLPLRLGLSDPSQVVKPPVGTAAPLQGHARYGSQRGYVSAMAFATIRTAVTDPASAGGRRKRPAAGPGGPDSPVTSRQFEYERSARDGERDVGQHDDGSNNETGQAGPQGASTHTANPIVLSVG